MGNKGLIAMCEKEPTEMEFVNRFAQQLYLVKGVDDVGVTEVDGTTVVSAHIETDDVELLEGNLNVFPNEETEYIEPDE